MVYSTALSVIWIIQRRVTELLQKNELEVKLRELVVALKYICIHWRERGKLRKNLFRGIYEILFEPGTTRK